MKDLLICCLIVMLLCQNLSAQDSVAADASNSFAFDTLRVIKIKRDNVAFSPFSVWIALTMTSAGASGDTLKEMQKVLHHPATADIHKAVSIWTKQLADLQGKGLPDKHLPGQDSKDINGIRLYVANRLFIAPEFPVLPTFDSLIKSNYQTELDPVAFSKDPTAARKHINQWISSQTADRIQNLLQPGSITKETRLVLANAIYFKAAWEYKFNVAYTTNLPFTRTSGEVVKAPMMSQSLNGLPYYETSDFQAIQLNYSGGKASLIVLLPSKGKALIPSAALYDQIRKGFTSQYVFLRLPRFTVEERTDFAPLLGDLGLKLPFSPAADFSALSGKPLRIDTIAHQAFIKVAEAGTEAAAATVVVANSRGLAKMEKPKEFLANRPFYFFITHEPSGGILFLGKVDEPDKATGK